MIWAPPDDNVCHFGHHCCWQAGDVTKKGKTGKYTRIRTFQFSVSKIFQSNLRSHARAVTIQIIWCKKGLVHPFFPIISVVTLNC